MTPLETTLSAFHFLRPLMLLGLVPLALIWWRQRRPARSDIASETAIASHLLAALRVDQTRNRRLHPIDLIALCLTLIIIAASGPTWSRVPTPFAAQTAPMVVALKVTPSMQNPDLAPNRLDRAKHKIQDLLSMRAGARTALIAYSGSAHSVVPMTEDGAVIQPYLEGLDPEIMPVEGNTPLAALNLALDALSRETTPGGVLFVLDDIATADVSQLIETAADTPVAFLIALPQDQTLPALSGSDVRVVIVTPDPSDLRQLERGFQAAYQQSQLLNGTQPWQDRGLLLIWPAILLLMFWFRRGVAVQWALLFVLCLILPAKQAQADGIKDWFFTPDQQGWLAYRNKDYDTAADRFADPYLRGVAQYRDGQYETAAQTLAQIDTADAAFVQGMAHIKSRGYRDGVRAFERALDLDPGHSGARTNLPVAEQIVTYVERVREQSDTGEDSGIGADEVVYDNEAGKGADTELQAPVEDGDGHLSTEQWMNTVDTRTGDFLKQRFRLEAAGNTQ
ncbi:VWA domain-containing protein [Shimia sp.]|uniref:VWA domain-containing protein n=1 Tax=Shimia sp. TaxID=1954381 RepID=UPI003299B152